MKVIMFVLTVTLMVFMVVIARTPTPQTTPTPTPTVEPIPTPTPTTIPRPVSTDEIIVCGSTDCLNWEQSAPTFDSWEEAPIGTVTAAEELEVLRDGVYAVYIPARAANVRLCFREGADYYRENDCPQKNGNSGFLLEIGADELDAIYPLVDSEVWLDADGGQFSVITTKGNWFFIRPDVAIQVNSFIIYDR